MIPPSSIVPSTAPRNALRDEFETFHIASSPVASRMQASTVLDSAVATRFSNALPNDGFVLSSSPLLSRKTAPASQSYLPAPEFDNAPSSPVLPRLFETPTKQRSSDITTFTDETLESTPPEPSRATNLFATPVKKGTIFVSTAVGAAVAGEPAPSIYQQLGWDDYDIDDLA